MARHPNRRQGEAAEKHVASKGGLAHCPDEADWYDNRNPRTGTKHEVKSTHEEIEGAHNPDDEGEFRVWSDQHNSLRASDAAGVAWYDFVLLDDDGNVVDHVRRKPSTVSKIVRENGGWKPAGHAERGDAMQCRIPHSEVFDR